ncbi:AraC family transcriptional regulator [Flagellimonas pacifica]|uniref:AraC-type DNA-binding protein n=1 Tax=Flagellimonas pacifica TaxID=1247520 RepID=A0A285MSL4_9FLAO|nr:AraC family transcriptional regulator [Allomuricauda parva]SNZ00180.1 AraC-type DNA-binding protein [Allomuricauda parva]
MQKQTNKRKVFNLGQLGFVGCHDFGYYHYNKVEPTLETHHHKAVLEICFCLKGQQYYQVGEDVFKLTGNHIFIVPPDVDHSSGVYPEDIGEVFWLQISLEKGKLCNLSGDQSEFLLGELIQRGNALFKGAFILKPILEKLIRMLEEPENPLVKLWGNQLIVQLLLETLVLAKEPQQMINSERLDILNDFIGKHLHRIVYVDELATLVNISTSHFKSWFKQHFGVPPKAYINRLKIEQAKKDLLVKKSITQVAFDLGFNSSQYFATIFKKYTGVSPRSYVTAINRQN